MEDSKRKRGDNSLALSSYPLPTLWLIVPIHILRLLYLHYPTTSDKDNDNQRQAIDLPNSPRLKFEGNSKTRK